MVVAPKVGIKSTSAEVDGTAFLLTMTPVMADAARLVVAFTFTRYGLPASMLDAVAKFSVSTPWLSDVLLSSFTVHPLGMAMPNGTANVS